MRLEEIARAKQILDLIFKRPDLLWVFLVFLRRPNLTEKIMSGWEACKLALNDPGLVITNGMNTLKFTDKGVWLIKDSTDSWGFGEEPKFDDLKSWTIEKLKPKLVTWYRPRVIWPSTSDEPTLFLNENIGFRREKETCPIYWTGSRSTRILEWEEIQAPETWEGCE